MAEETRMPAEQGNIGTSFVPKPEPTPTVDKPTEKPSTPTDKPSTPPPTTRRDSVSAALDKVEAKKAESPQGTQQKPLKTGPTPVGDDRPRNEKGQFVKQDMPRAWKQEYRPKWDALAEGNPEMAKFLAELEDKRSKDFESGVGIYRQAAEWAKPLQQVLTPYEKALQQQYGGLAPGIHQILQAWNQAVSNPQQFIEEFARQRGINFGQQQQNPEALALQQALMPALDPVVQRLQALEGQLSRVNTSQTQATEHKALQIVDTFLSQKDEAGNLKYPLTDDVNDSYAAQIAFVRGQHPDWDDQRVLESAYENLTWSHPQMRQARLDKELANRQAQEEKALAEKRAAAVQVSGAPPTGAAPKIDVRDRRSAIAAAFDRVSR